MDRFEALAQLESGGNDFAVGNAGEVSRYQIMPQAWNEIPLRSISQATNAAAARVVARNIWYNRVVDFQYSHQRMPTDSEWALLWHCPARVDHPTKGDRDYTNRFINLLSKH